MNPVGQVDGELSPAPLAYDIWRDWSWVPVPEIVSVAENTAIYGLVVLAISTLTQAV